MALGFLCIVEIKWVGPFESGVLMKGFNDSFLIVPFFEVVFFLFE